MGDMTSLDEQPTATEPGDDAPASIRIDPEYLALRALAELTSREQPPTPTDALEELAHLAKALTHARYAALGVTDQQDRIEGFVTSGIDDESLAALKSPPQGHALLGSLRAEGRPIRIDNIDDHPETFGFPPRHPDMKALLGVPVWSHGEVRGSLYVTDRDGDKPFTEDDETILLTLAHHARFIIENEWH